jgi:mannose-6-phosphate isomerase class I
MNIFDLSKISAESYDSRSMNVFFKNEFFKTRIIEIEPNGAIPKCQMSAYVIFVCLSGSVVIQKNDEVGHLKCEQVFISDPATIAMESVEGARLLGIQINSQK